MNVSYAPLGSERVLSALGYGGPHGQPHFMVTCAAMIDSHVCVRAFGKPLDACDFHLSSAPTHGTFGAARL
jgi:hypothetical protein